MESFIVPLAVAVASGLLIAAIIAICRGPIWSGLKRGQEAARAAMVRRACQRGDHDWRFVIGSLATGEMVYQCNACEAAKTNQIDT